MELDWKSDSDYHYAVLEDGEDMIGGIRELVTKALELAENKKDWNCLMMDIWMFNLARLICNIQNKEQAVGMDRGYRVALQFKEYHNKLEETAENQYDPMLIKFKNELVTKIRLAFQDRDFLMSFDDLWVRNPFTVRFASQGQLLNIELKFG